MRAKPGILLALAALGMAGCGDASSRSVAPAAPAATPEPAAKLQSAARAWQSGPQPIKVEQAFAKAMGSAVSNLFGEDLSNPAASPDDVFTPLREAGVAGPSFDGEADYSAWISPRRPLRFLGHEVTLVIAEDMRRGFIGCCVDRGVTLVLNPAADRAALQQFADARRCTIELAADNTRFELATTDSPAIRDRTGLIALSCHEMDRME